MQTMTRYRTNLCLVNDENGLAGIITDGDLRRNLAGAENLSGIKAKHIMNSSPVCIQEKTSAEEARTSMTKDSLHSLVVKNQDQQVVGILTIDQLHRL